MGLHVEHVADAYVGGGHVVGLVPRVVADVRGIDAHVERLAVQTDLRLAVEHVAYLLPVDQVVALVDGHSGEICRFSNHFTTNTKLTFETCINLSGHTQAQHKLHLLVCKHMSLCLSKPS